MSDFIGDFEKQTNADAASTRRREADEHRDAVAAEKARLDFEQDNEEAKQKAIAERKITLDWAWVAAGLLKESKVVPTLWTYDYVQKRRLFGHDIIAQGIAAEGWQLLDWQNTRYAPAQRHTLLLSPSAEDNSDIHLKFFSQRPPVDYVRDEFDEPAQVILPTDVHSLSREPLSEEDMPWPPRTNAEDMHDTLGRAFGVKRDQKPRREAPWKDESSITINAFDGDIEMTKLFAEMSYETGSVAHDWTKRPPIKEDYDEYKRAGIEKSIRLAIAHVAAQHLVIAPEKIAQTIKRRAELGVE
ncbi:MAG: hypothetical protein ABIP50_00370 [Candidatus Saccharimonadales bacterium]